MCPTALANFLLSFSRARSSASPPRGQLCSSRSTLSATVRTNSGSNASPPDGCSAPPGEKGGAPGSSSPPPSDSGVLLPGHGGTPDGDSFSGGSVGLRAGGVPALPPPFPAASPGLACPLLSDLRPLPSDSLKSGMLLTGTAGTGWLKSPGLDAHSRSAFCRRRTCSGLVAMPTSAMISRNSSSPASHSCCSTRYSCSSPSVRGTAMARLRDRRTA